VIVYVDTSVVLRILLEQPGTIRSWGGWASACSSTLLGVEARRTIDRFRREQQYDDERVAQAHERLVEIEQSVRRIEIDRRVLARASGPMPTTVKTLDAIHLASALLLAERMSEKVIFATHDRRLAIAATALGFRCVG